MVKSEDVRYDGRYEMIDSLVAPTRSQIRRCVENLNFIGLEQPLSMTALLIAMRFMTITYNATSYKAMK